MKPAACDNGSARLSASFSGPSVILRGALQRPPAIMRPGRPTTLMSASCRATGSTGLRLSLGTRPATCRSFLISPPSPPCGPVELYNAIAVHDSICVSFWSVTYAIPLPRNGLTKAWFRPLDLMRDLRLATLESFLARLSQCWAWLSIRNGLTKVVHSDARQVEN
jgi:hypothetical protein